MRIFRRWPRTVYGCGNCRETFKTEAQMYAHQPCPLVAIEREIADWNARAWETVRERGLA